MKIKNVSVVFDGFQALTDVNVKVKRNSIHFFIGPNGAGKTALLDIICAKTKPTGGNVSFYPMHGEKVRLTGMKEYKIVKEGVVRKFQAPSVFVNLTVGENMELSLKGNKGVWQSIFQRTSEDETAIFQMCEILTCGRYARGERFAYRSFRNYMEIRRGGRLIYRDNTWYETELFSMEETGMMEGFTHQANLFVTKPEDGEAFCEEVRNLLEDERKNCQGGITRLAEGDYAVRLFGWRGQVLEELSDKILRLLRKNPV